MYGPWTYTSDDFVKKIEANPSDPKYVYTKWGVGYYFRG